MTFRNPAAGRTKATEPSRVGEIVWDAAEGGGGPRLKGGAFMIERPRFWRRLLAVLLVNVSAYAMAKTVETPAPVPPAGSNDMNIQLAQTPSTGTVTTPSCSHHDSHNDKIMQSLNGSHLDQHGDLSC